MHTQVSETLVYRDENFLKLEKILNSGLSPGLPMGPPGTFKHSDV